MIFKVIIRSKAQRQLNHLEIFRFQRITAEIKSLEDNPFPFGYAKLAGIGAYRIRVGSFRIIYEVNVQERLVEILKVERRETVYDRL